MRNLEFGIWNLECIALRVNSFKENFNFNCRAAASPLAWRDHPDYLSKKSLTQSRKAAKICNVIDCFLSTISHDKV